ncbi:sugar phosphate isomerase/epimerase [Pontibacter sp. 172403-2]|uniref:sugar phosphate isomerase/epimerase family protein n=1 Tax=Pontibacter rufus TaxID=2791028 RepID=UPI0018AFAABB|nr:sugar phosphate isomerase/epimerase [Pontibacter sp. 172403-2]MBF9254334.1 sugar phosphate isomerase/epimerase [Pontibacter sp. 172403-2]
MNKRRTFLQQLGMLSAGFMLAPAMVSCNQENKSAAETTATGDEPAAGNTATAEKAAISAVGLQLYTLREQLPADVKGVIAKVAKAGYNDVETYGYSKENGFWGLEPKAFKALLDENGLISSSGHYGLEGYLGKSNEDELQTNIAAAVAVGQKYLTIPHLGEAIRSSADAYKTLAERMNMAGEICKKAGLQLAYHNHNFEFLPQGDTTGYEILLTETNPDLVKFEADLFWMVRAGKQPVDMFEQYPGRFPLWHVKDMDKNNQDLNIEIGSGSINYKQIFDQAKTAGLERIFVEQENFAEGMDPYQSISQSYDYIKKTLIS